MVVVVGWNLKAWWVVVVNEWLKIGLVLVVVV